jgi:hypothetical protein
MHPKKIEKASPASSCSIHSRFNVLSLPKPAEIPCKDFIYIFAFVFIHLSHLQLAALFDNTPSLRPNLRQRDPQPHPTPTPTES